MTFEKAKPKYSSRKCLTSGASSRSPDLGAVSYAGVGGLWWRSASARGIDELKRIQAATHGLHILVSAGVTKQEYSQRLEDALLKIGDLELVAKEIAPKFPKKEQETATEILSHISKSIEAYKDAREYFGEKFTGAGCEEGCSLLSQIDYDALKSKFPSLVELKADTVWHSLYPDSPPDYYRDDMLMALWKVASEEDAAAQSLIGNLK